MTTYNTILLSANNAEKINKALDNVQKRCRERLITLEDIYEIKDKMEDYLRTYSTKKALEGTRIEVDYHAQSFPRCYKGIPMSTQFELIFEGGRWRITLPGRYRCTSRRFRIHLSEAAQKEVIYSFCNVE